MKMASNIVIFITFLKEGAKMSVITEKQKRNLYKKLKEINVTSEKDILNLKVADLKKIQTNENIENLKLQDIEIIWSMQEAIENKNLFEFFMK